MRRNPVPAARAAFTAIVAAFVLLFSGYMPPVRAAGQQISAEVRARAQRTGRARILVQLRRADAATLIAQLPAGSRVVHRFRTMPIVAVDASPAALDALEALGPDVVGITEDRILKPVLAESVPLIQADQAWAAGYDGTGMMIAVIDTGVDSTHPFLAGKVDAEACFSSNIPGMSQSLCPNGLDQQIGPGAGAPCPLADCLHGTHVAGIAAGFDTTGVHTASGVAKGAHVMAIQVFSKIIDAGSCGGTAPCLGGFTSDIIAALEHVYEVALAGTYQIASVNMSLGEGLFETQCDDQPYKPAIDNLRSLGIASIAAAGNDGYPWAMIAPACVSTAISVGATTKQNEVAWFSNVASFLSLFAPGDSIVSSVPGGGYEALSGTSMATPHVAGTWAILKQAVPGADVSTLLNALQTTGLPITDSRFGGIFGDEATIPLVQVYDALASIATLSAPQPSIASLSPASTRAGFGALTLTVTGSGFTHHSVVQWNGSPRPTTFVNASTLTAAISDADVSAVGSALVSVTTPAPGGGTTSTLPFAINNPPQLSTSAAVVIPGDSATVTLTDGVGGSSDWLALSPTGTNDATYSSWTYVGAGVTSRTWTVVMPTAAGTYEFRLFVNNRRVAVSPSITVDPNFGPVPTLSSLSPAGVVANGPAFTLTVNGSKFVNRSVVKWNGSPRATTFVSATQLQASITAADIATAGSAVVTVFTSTPGGGTSGALTITIDAPPVLTVSASSVTSGSSVTMTLTNGRGGSGDWLALAMSGSANTSYVQWVYVGAVTSRTWTVTMPTSPATYEFRLFLNNSYLRAATSPPVTVTASPPQPTLTVDATSVTVGANVTVRLTNGAGGAADWLAFAAVGAPDSSFVQSVNVGAGITTRTWTVTAPSTGTYEFRLFVNNARAATSPPVTVVAPSSVPTISVSAANVALGAPVTATLTNAPGGSGDWLALAATTAPNSVYIAWTYVGAGVTSRTWTQAMPTSPGTYEFRLFLNNTYARGATSPPVTVAAVVSPSLTVSSTSVAAGTSVTVTLNNGTGATYDWLAFAPVGSPNTSYLQWVWVGAGVSTRTWTVTVPSPGTYEFRLFLNNTYTRGATSPAITGS
jgi:subtilisin family serine protease